MRSEGMRTIEPKLVELVWFAKGERRTVGRVLPIAGSFRG